MPLDPRIPAMAQRPKINTPFENLASILAERRATMQDQTAQAELRQRARIEQEQQTLQRTLQTLPDLSDDSLQQVIRIAPNIGPKWVEAIHAGRKEAADTATKEYDLSKKQHEDGMHLLAVAKMAGPAGYAQFYPHLAKLLPEMAGFLGPQYDPQKIAAAEEYAVDQEKKVEAQRAAQLALWKGELGPFAQQFADEQDPEEKQHMLGAASLFFPPGALDQVAKNPQAFTMTPAQRETQAGAAEGRQITREGQQATAARAAIDDRRADAQLGISQEQLALAKQREARQAKQAAAGGARGAGGATYSAAVEQDLATALDRATLNLPGTRRTQITNLANRLADNGQTDELKQVIRQAAVETEPVDTRRQIEGRGNAAAALRDIRAGLKELQAAGVSTNVLRGNVEDAARALGTSTNPKLVAIGTRIKDAMIEYRRSLTGVAFGEAEGRDYERLFPNYRNTLPVNEAILDGLERGFTTRDKVYWTRKLGPSGAALVGAVPEASGGGVAAPAAGTPQRRQIKGGGIAELRNGKWVRVE